MPDPARLLSIIARAQRSALIGWLLGMRRFDMFSPAPGGDPMMRMRIRLLTIIETVAALLVTLVTLIIVGIVALAAPESVLGAGVMLVGGCVALLFVMRSLWRSMRAKMSAPGLAWVVGVLNIAAMAAALALSMDRGGAA